MTVEALRGRLERLDALSRGFGKELELLAHDDGPLLYRERVDYRGAISRALDGVETARVAIAHAVQRLTAG